MKVKTFEDLYIHELKDLYSAESMLLNALPKVAEKVQNKELKQALESHLEETKRQKERLEKIFENLDQRPGGEKCEAMEGLIEEGKEILEMDGADENVRDAGIIGAQQRIEHYEISAYGTARTFAERLGREEDVRILSEILDEESNADQKLTKIAESVVNPKAQKESKS